MGGAIGYLSYDLKSTSKKHPLIPKMIMGVYDWAVVVDHLNSESWLIKNDFDGGLGLSWESLQSLFVK